MKKIKDPLKFSASIKKAIEKVLDDKKATDIISINLAGKSDIADFMVIATGSSGRHVASLAEYVVQIMRDKGISKVSTEGMSSAHWIVIDSPYVVVHIFQPEARGYYNLEKMWADDYSAIKKMESGS